jgi:hypothetical protein
MAHVAREMLKKELCQLMKAQISMMVSQSSWQIPQNIAGWFISFIGKS